MAINTGHTSQPQLTASNKIASDLDQVIKYLVLIDSNFLNDPCFKQNSAKSNRRRKSATTRVPTNLPGVSEFPAGMDNPVFVNDRNEVFLLEIM